MKPTVWLLGLLLPCEVFAQSTVRLGMLLSNAVPVVIWNDPAAVLQGATSLAGSWTTLSNATSPYEVSASNPAAFFRLRLDCTSLSAMVSWWAGDGTANDLVGTNNGTLMGGGVYAPGEVGQAFSLNGNSAWVDVPNSDLLNPTGPFSVECWIQASSQQYYAQVLIVDKSHGWTDGTGWGIQTTANGNAGFFYGIGGPTGDSKYFPYVATANSVLDDRWHHLAGVWTGTQLEIYEDGLLHGSLSQTNLPANNSRDVEIGRSWGGGNGSRFFHGLIDEVTYFNRALSPNEVAAIFGAGAAGKCKP